MTTAASKPKTEATESSETLWPGPALHGTRYNLVMERAGVRETIALGRQFNTHNGAEGTISAITYMSDGVIRVTISVGSDRDVWVDLFGQWMGVVSPTGERFHKPVLVSPAVAAARTALGKLNQADRAAALEGYTPKPAA